MLKPTTTRTGMKNRAMTTAASSQSRGAGRMPSSAQLTLRRSTPNPYTLPISAITLTAYSSRLATSDNSIRLPTM
ncbi:MAG: hypothetical protein HW378_4386 [Anaerolineales bacterium]|nr:hypothetical protein [Anaerolineales bacterium]